MLAKFEAWCHAKAPFLVDDKMPVWFTILASIMAGSVAAAGTYFIAPAVNRQYQVDEARSAHIAKTTEGLNEEIIALSQKIRRLNDALVNNPSKAADAREDCLDLVTKLQWMLVDLRVVLKTDQDRAAVKNLEASIDGVKKALDQSIDARAQKQLLLAMRALGEQTRDVLDRLYITASLK